MVRADDTARNNPGYKKQFLRFQVTAITATIVDFLVTILLKEKLDIYYAWSVAFGAIAGAITAFTINRYWVFRAIEKNPLVQGFRYLIIVAGSIVLNTAGTYIMTESLKSPYLISKALIALIIGFTYSYYFSKRFVFYA